MIYRLAMKHMRASTKHDYITIFGADAHVYRASAFRAPLIRLMLVAGLGRAQRYRKTDTEGSPGRQR